MKIEIATYCPNCEKLTYMTLTGKKEPKCNLCENENIIVELKGLQDENRILKKYKGRLIYFIIFLIITFTLIPIVALEIALTNPTLLIIIVVIILIPIVFIGIEFTFSRPYTKEITKYLIEKINGILPDNISTLPIYDEMLDLGAKRQMKNPEGLKVLRMKDYYPSNIFTITCNECKSMNIFDAKYCTLCGAIL